MRGKKILLIVCVVWMVFSIFLASCRRRDDSISTPGTGEEHSLPSAQAGYPAEGGLPTPESGYPQP